MRIPFIDFGGSGTALHLAHANGYPPGAYRALLEGLAADFHAQAMFTRAQWPGSTPNGLRNWHPMVDDLLRFLEQDGTRQWIGVGHSLGGVLTASAALRRPDLFRAVVLIDPVFLPPPLQLAWGAAKRLGLGGLHPLIPGAAKRRRRFANADEMFERYRRAPVFGRIDDQGLRNYVDALAQPLQDGGVTLAYAPEWETKIYATSTLNLWPRLKRFQPPLLILRGCESDTFYPAAVAAVRRRLPSATLVDVPDTGHLLPLEKPAEVGQLIREFAASA